MKPLSYAPHARRDLVAIGRQIAADNPARAQSFVAELRAAADRVAARPLSFRSRDEIRPGLRSAVHGRYLLFFRILDEEIRIVRIVHSARELRKLPYD